MNVFSLLSIEESFLNGKFHFCDVLGFFLKFSCMI